MSVNKRRRFPSLPYHLPKEEVLTMSRYRMLRSPHFAELCQLFEERLTEDDRDLFLELAAKLELTFHPALDVNKRPTEVEPLVRSR